METLTAKELASRLNGRTYWSEISQMESDIALVNGLVVVYGASDDLMEFRGVINDEIGCYEGTTVFLNSDGIIGDCDNDDTCDYKQYCTFFKTAIKSAKSIKAIWNNKENPSWEYETDIPHETFDILEDGEVYCKGIVFSMDSLKEDGIIEMSNELGDLKIENEQLKKRITELEDEIERIELQHEVDMTEYDIGDEK